MTASDETVEDVMTPTTVVELAGQRLQPVRHPRDGRIVPFTNGNDASAFAVSLEAAASAGTVIVPLDEPLHMQRRGGCQRTPEAG
jgi:hypothetical protein